MTRGSDKHVAGTRALLGREPSCQWGAPAWRRRPAQLYASEPFQFASGIKYKERIFSFEYPTILIPHFLSF